MDFIMGIMNCCLEVYVLVRGDVIWVICVIVLVYWVGIDFDFDWVVVIDLVGWDV